MRAALRISSSITTSASASTKLSSRRRTDVTWSRLSLLFLLGAIALQLVGCNQRLDLNSVQNLSTIAASSQIAFDAISGDFYDSCVRRQRFLNNFDPITCSPQRKASETWQSANAMLLAYYRDLGALATDKQTDFGLAGLANSIAAINGVPFSKNQQDAVVDAGKGLLLSFFAGRIREDLAKIMTQAELPDEAHKCPEGSLLTTVKAPSPIAQDEYNGTILAAEDGQIQLFYTANISLAEAVPKPTPATHVVPLKSTDSAERQTIASLGALGRLIVFGYYSEESTARAAVASKRDATTRYIAALNKLVDAYQKIVQSLRRNDLDQIAGIVNTFIATYFADLNAVEKAFH